MSDDNNIGEAQAPQTSERQEPPKLRPHLTVTRTLTYRGDSEILKKNLAQCLPEGLYLSGNGAFTLEVRTTEIVEDAPQWLGVAKQELLQRAQDEAEQAKAKSQILSPHTLRPVN